MEKRDVLTKTLAVVGTVLVWLPVLAPFIFFLVRFIQGRRLNFDYLMPAELFPLFLVGAALLVWAALRAHSRQKFIGGGLAAAVGLLVAGQVLAVITGLASGAAEPTGWKWMLVLGSLAAYTLAVISVGVGGILLLRSLFNTPRLPPSAGDVH